jgi:DNA-binding beta-propeller fold protein YncE
LPCFTLSCADPEPGVEPYDGPPAYPNLRASFSAEGRRLAYVSNSLSDTISVLDLDPFELLSEVPVGRNPVDVDGPHHLAIDREAGLLYVALAYPALGAPGPHAGHGLSEQFGYAARLALDDLRSLGDARVEASPGDLALSPSGERLVVSHYDLLRAAGETLLEDRRASLVWFDPADQIGSEATVSSRLTVCIAPHAMAFASDEDRVFVACAGEDSIAVVDLVEERVEAMVPVAPAIGRPGVPVHQPYAFASDASAERLAVSNIYSKTLALFSIEDLPERLWVTQLLGAPYFAAWLDDARIVVPIQAPSGVAILDAETGELVGESSFAPEHCLNPHEAVVSSEGRLFFVCEGDRIAPGSVLELDPESLEIVRRLEVGVYPDRLLLLAP